MVQFLVTRLRRLFSSRRFSYRPERRYMRGHG